MITLDGTNTSSANETGVSSLTFSRVTASGSNTGILVQVVCYGTNRATSGVTFNSVSLTKLKQNDANNVNASLWFLPNPSVGTYNVVVTQPGNCDGISATAIALFGVQQGTTPDSTSAGGTFTNGSSPITESITTVAANCWLFDAIGDQTKVLTKGAAQTLSLNQFGGTGMGSYKGDVSAGSNSMTWTFSSGTESGVYALAALAPAVTTTTKTTTGVARITATTSKTETGIARITKTTSQTITGVASITAGETTTPQTITGVSRITKTVGQTISGLSRITASTTKNQTGLSRITASAIQDITGKARVTASTNQTITGKGRITVTTTQTVSGKARIGLITNQTMTGLSRITKSVSQTISGLSRITATTVNTITGKARIEKTVSQTIAGVSRIGFITSKTISGISRITAIATQTLTGKSRITATSTQTITGKAKIVSGDLTSTQTITGKASISSTISENDRIIFVDGRPALRITGRHYTKL